MKVVDPAGNTWRVSRRWLPWRRRTTMEPVAGLPTMPTLGDDPISAVIGLVLLVLFLPFVVFFFLVAGAVALELLLLLLVLPFALVGRVFLGRHWHVEVKHIGDLWWEGDAGDWQRSGRAIEQIAEGLRRGELPDQAARGITPE